jgi:divalent metal cation (Fe/Co/Zn/Cd) transporter
VIAVILVIEMKALLIGEAASPQTIRNIHEAMESTDPVRRVIHLRTQHLGPEELLVGAKLSFDGNLDLPSLSEAINEVENRVRQAVPAARVIYIEPDVEREPEGRPVS